MDKRILALYADNSGDVLEATLDKLNPEQLKKFVADAIRTSSTDPVQLIKAICRGSPTGNGSGLQRRRALFRDALDCVNDESQGDKVCGDVIGILMMEVDSFPVEQLAELCDYFLGKIKAGDVSNARCLELFPKVLSSIQWVANVPLSGECEGDMTGASYKSHMINKVCSCKWSPAVVIHLTGMFRDVNMTNEELHFVLEKVVRVFPNVPLTELPPLVYQLLLLASKGHKRLVLDGLCAYFSKLDKQCVADQNGADAMEQDLQPEAPVDLRPTQGTVILHITFAAKQDQDLGREFVKTLKMCQQRSSTSVLSPFVLALALSLARIRRFEEPVFEILTSTIGKSFRDAERRRVSRWAYETSPVVSNIASLLMEVCRLSGWEHVTQGLVQLGFLLMDSNAPKSSGFCAATPQQQTCALGSSVLLETFKVHDTVRADILQQILNRIVVKTSSSVSHYLDLLTSAAVRSPQTLLDSLPKIREAFDYLSYLPLSSAIGLLRSVQPLMKLSTSLKDSLILVLRKALFSREVDSRKVGLAGFLLLLRKLKVLGGCVPCSQASQPWSASQIQVEVHSQVRPSGHEALCLDILGNIRRCMTQQLVIRKMLYQGLYHVLVANPELRTSVLDLLRRQLQLYYVADVNVTSPVSLESCFSMAGDVAKCNEPLGDLLLAVQSCLQQCMQWLETADEENITADERNVIDTTQKMVAGIVKRLQTCELEDFDLDKSAEYSTATSVGAKNHLSANLVLSLYEAAIEFVFMDGGFSAESGQSVCKLFAVHELLTHVLADKAAAGVKRGRSGGSKSSQRSSLFSLPFLTHYWKALFSDQLPSHQECLTPLRASTSLNRYLLNVTHQHLQQLYENGHSLLADGKYRENDLQHCTTIARMLLSQFVKAVSQGVVGDASGVDLTAVGGGGAGAKDKGKSVPSLCLECVLTAMQIMVTCPAEKLWLFLDSLESAYECGDARPPSDAHLDGHVSFHIQQLQGFVVSLISANYDDLGYRDCQLVLQLLQLLSDHLPPESDEYSELCSWLVRISTERNINDTALVKSLVQLLLKLTDACKASLSVVRRLCRDIHCHLGDVEEDVELDEQGTTFAVVNPRTAAPTVLALICSHLETVLDSVNWIIMKAKLSYSASDAGEEDADQDGRVLVENIEQPVCQRLVSAVSAANDIVQSAIPPGQSREHILKMCKVLYTTLGALAKFQLSLYNKQQGNISGIFQKLVTLTGSHLAQEVYSFITYIQLPDNEPAGNGGQVTAKKGKKGAKAGKKPAGSGKVIPPQVLREQRAIPALIFAIEQYERFLIQLSKKSKVNLMTDFKRSTARDFRINGAVLEAALQQRASDEDEEDDDDDSVIPADDNTCPLKKTKGGSGGGGGGLSRKLAHRLVRHKEPEGEDDEEDEELELLADECAVDTEE